MSGEVRLTEAERFDLRVAVDRVYAIPAPRGVNDLGEPSLLDTAVEAILTARLAPVEALVVSGERRAILAFLEWRNDTHGPIPVAERTVDRYLAEMRPAAPAVGVEALADALRQECFYVADRWNGASWQAKVWTDLAESALAWMAYSALRAALAPQPAPGETP